MLTAGTDYPIDIMVRKSNEKTRPAAPGSELQDMGISKTDSNVSLSVVKNIPRWKHAELFKSIQNDGSTIVAGLFDDTPTLYWLDLYKKIKLSRAHASEIIGRLIEGVHYIALTRFEIKAIIKLSVNKSLTLNVRPEIFYFLTEEGWYRAVQDIGTGYMDDPEVAANINKLKDEMASIYAKYRRGEVLNAPQVQSPFPDIPYQPAARVLQDQLEIAKIFAVTFTVPIGKVNSVAIRNTEDITGVNLRGYSRFILVEPSEENKEALNATQIAELVGLEGTQAGARKVNQAFSEMGFHTKVSGGNDWIETSTGAPHVLKNPYTKGFESGSKHTGYQIRWKPDVIPLLKEHFKQKEERGETLSKYTKEGAV